jgi:hypothetical protein
MTLADLIIILKNKLTVLSQLKTSAINCGELDQVIKLEEEETATTLLIAQLEHTQTGM